LQESSYMLPGLGTQIVEVHLGLEHVTIDKKYQYDLKYSYC